MELSEALSFLVFVFEKRDNELLYQQWCGNFFSQEMSFADFKERQKQKPVKDDEEILEGVMEILEMFAEGRDSAGGNI